MEFLAAAAQQSLRELIDEYRDRCLWYLRRDYYPASREEALRVLDAIERHGSVEAFQRAARVRSCLSPRTSVPSAER